MGVRASHVVSPKKSRIDFMSKIGNHNIQLSPPEQAPPASATVNIANDDISELSQQAKLNQERITLFRYAVYGALFAFSILIVLLCCVIYEYISLLRSNQTAILSSNFWHIPLMIAVMATSILYATLKSSAHFGENKSQNDKQNTDSLSVIGNLPIWQELIDTIKSLKSSK